MRKLAAPLLICAALFAGPAQAQDNGGTFTDAERAKFVTVVVAMDCHITDQNAEMIAKETGFSDQKLQAILTDFIQADEVKPDGTGKGIVLLNEECS